MPSDHPVNQIMVPIHHVGGYLTYPSAMALKPSFPAVPIPRPQDTLATPLG